MRDGARVLGRVVKEQDLTIQSKGVTLSYDPLEGDVYRTQTTQYDAHDRPTEVKDQTGTSGTWQLTTYVYDGHGRLQSRRGPEATAAITYTYNADDTVLTKTDGRGAVCTYGFNARHLPTSRSHVNGADQINVTYQYDAAGNRTRMTDGPQTSVTYHHDTLSRMDWEERAFPQIGAKRLNYSYTPDDKLKTLSGPAGAQFTYQYDTAGRLERLTGASYANVTTYVDLARYRTSGGIKSASFGNGASQTTNHDARLRPKEFRLTGNVTPIRENYSYYDDGCLQAITALDDTQGSNPPATIRFMSRSFSYDLVGRVTGAGGGTTPYVESYGYDEFNNLTARSGKYWYGSYVSDSSTYTNRRHNATSTAVGCTLDGVASNCSSVMRMVNNGSAWIYLISSTGGYGSIFTSTGIVPRVEREANWVEDRHESIDVDHDEDEKINDPEDEVVEIWDDLQRNGHWEYTDHLTYKFFVNDSGQSTSTQPTREEMLNEDVGAALNAVQNGRCRALFGNNDPVELINKYKRDGLFKWARVHDREGNTMLNIGAQHNKDGTVTINTRGPYVTLLTSMAEARTPTRQPIT